MRKAIYPNQARPNKAHSQQENPQTDNFCMNLQENVSDLEPN